MKKQPLSVKGTAHIPNDVTGTYTIYNAAGSIIYTGHSIHLKRRLRLYYQPNNSNPNPHVRDIRRNGTHYTLTYSRLKSAQKREEKRLKKHKPKYNIRRS